MAMSSRNGPHPPSGSTEDLDPDAAYRALMDSVTSAWEELERQGATSVQVRPHVRQLIRSAVRAESRRGRQVEVAPTPVGPLTLSEASVRALVRAAIDETTGVRALRSVVEYGPPEHRDNAVHTVGPPTVITCRIGARIGVDSLPATADRVRHAVTQRLHDELAVSDVRIDIHIEELL